MFNNEREPLTLLVELTPRLAKRRYRQAIYDAWDHKCGYCEATATSLDHIIPKFQSGSSYRNNLIPACRSCNADKALKWKSGIEYKNFSMKNVYLRYKNG